MEMEISPPAIEIIKEYETLQLTAYQDGESVSIGYGHSNLSGGEQFELGDTIDEEKANELLLADLEEIERIVNQRMKNYGVTFTQGQYDGIVVGTYNRPEKIKSKSLYETVASGDANAINEVWDNTISDNDKEKYPGLIDRQAAEKDLINNKEVTTDTTATMEEELNPDYESPQEIVPGFDPSQPTDAERVRTPRMNPSQMMDYTSQVPLAAQNKAYGRVRQMLEAQVNKQKSIAGHAPVVPGVSPQVGISFNKALEIAFKLLGR